MENQNEFGGDLISKLIRFLRGESGAKIGWCLLTLLSFAASYLSIHSTLVTLTYWAASRALDAGSLIILSVALNVFVLAVSFGAWHELRRPANFMASNALSYAKTLFRKLPWALVLLFQIAWVLAPRTGNLLLGCFAAVFFMLFPLILEKAEDSFFGQRAERRINRIVLSLGGVLALVVVPVWMSFDAIRSCRSATTLSAC